MRGFFSAVTLFFMSLLLALAFQNCQQSESQFKPNAQPRQIEGFSEDFMKSVSDLTSDQKKIICDSAQQYECTLRRYSKKLTDETSSDIYCLDSEKTFCVNVKILDYNSSASDKPDYAEAFCENLWIENNSGVEVRFDSQSVGEALVSSINDCNQLMNLK